MSSLLSVGYKAEGSKPIVLINFSFDPYNLLILSKLKALLRSPARHEIRRVCELITILVAHPLYFNLERGEARGGADFRFPELDTMDSFKTKVIEQHFSSILVTLRVEWHNRAAHTIRQVHLDALQGFNDILIR